MIEFIKRQKIILLLFALWYAVGSFSVPAFFGLGLLSIFLMWRKAMYFEILLGFFFILILSDNLRYTTDFAKLFKNVYIVLLTAIAILDRKKMNASSSIFKPFLPFVIIGLVGLFFSPVMFTGFQKTLSYLLILFTVPVFFINAFQERGQVVVKDLVFFGVGMILFGFLWRFVDPSLVYSHGGRFRAIFGNPNGLGIFSILIFALAFLARDYFSDLFSKNDLRWIVLPILVAIFFSASRAAVIGLGLLFVFARFYKVSPLFGFIGFVGAVVVAEVVSNNVVAIVNSMGLSEVFRVDTLEDGSGRFIAWNFAWLNIQDYFWFGRGFAFDEWLMTENQELLNDLGHQGGVHNTFLIVWLNTGLIGLLLFLRALILLFIKASKNTRFAFPIFWMILFSIMFEPWLAASLNPFTILLICMLTLMIEPCFQAAASQSNIKTDLPDEVPVLA